MANDSKTWRCGKYELSFDRPRIMGVLNVTPDSFSDGGEHFDPDAAIEYGLAMLDAGADIIDVGGESTRPGFTPVNPDEEARRVLPVVRALAKEGAIVSIDTRHVAVAKAAVRCGASIVNDVTGFTDPKMVEFSLYSKIEKHFLAKMESEDEAIVTDPRKAVYTLNSLCTEMDNRLELCKMAGARNIAEYNDKFTARRLNPEKGHRYLPYIVVVVDEFADLIMTAREVEGPVMRLAQKARAIGIHLIIATQRPDVKVITGGIKANFPARIAFRVMQMIDSRTIIDQPGANQLIGRGDMLFSKDGELIRIQCALVETREVERIVDFIGRQQGYSEAYRLPDYVPESSGGESSSLGSESGAPVRYDTLFADIARAAVSQGQISTSSIQRNYEVGFNRAGRIMMQLERAGIVGRQEGAKPRDILFHDLPSLEARLQELGVF